MTTIIRPRCFQNPNQSTAAWFLLVMLWSGGSLRAGDSDKAFTDLCDGLKGGPIGVRLDAKAAPRLGYAAAERALVTFTGMKDVKPSRAWPVLLTDREFIGGWMIDRPCWLFEFQTDPRVPREWRTKFPVAYVAIDAETGAILEAFTRPAEAWWKRVAFRDDQVTKRFEARGQYSSPPRGVPNVTLEDALIAAWKRVDEDYWLRAQQFIVRHFEFTDANKGLGIERIDGFETIPSVSRHPVWSVSLEGINSQTPSLRPRKVEGANVLISARSGEVLSYFFFR